MSAPKDYIYHRATGAAADIIGTFLEHRASQWQRRQQWAKGQMVGTPYEGKDANIVTKEAQTVGIEFPRAYFSNTWRFDKKRGFSVPDTGSPAGRRLLDEMLSMDVPGGAELAEQLHLPRTYLIREARVSRALTLESIPTADGLVHLVGVPVGEPLPPLPQEPRVEGLVELKMSQYWAIREAKDE